MSRNTVVTQPNVKQGYVKRKRGIASLDSTNGVNKMSTPNHARDIFSNDDGVVLGGANGKIILNGSKTCSGASGKKSQNKAYEMIRQAIGYNKEGPTYQNFSNIFSLHGQGSSSIGLAQTIKNMSEGRRAKGTTADMAKANKQQKNEEILASFKSKILQQMNDKLRHTTTDLGHFSG